jgi:RNA polymerase sigma-70 factor, ECF subfamily
MSGEVRHDVARDTAESARLFAEYRSAVVGAAYRVLGSLSDAEDVAQETWLRWVDVPLAEVTNPRAYLVRIGTRLALNRLRQLSRQRETYVGPWLPEPIDDLSRVGADATLEVAESVSLAMLVLLESLTPAERAAFVLHDVFDVPYDEVAGTLDRSSASVRQLVHRARGRLREAAPRHPVDADTHRRVTQQFLQAVQDGSITDLVGLMAPDVVLITDGGGVKQAALRPIYGPDKIIRFVAGALAKTRDVRDAVFACQVNGQPAIAVLERQPGSPAVIDSVCVLNLDDNLVSSILLVRNPEKLVGLTLP